MIFLLVWSIILGIRHYKGSNIAEVLHKVQNYHCVIMTRSSTSQKFLVGLPYHKQGSIVSQYHLSIKSKCFNQIFSDNDIFYCILLLHGSICPKSAKFVYNYLSAWPVWRVVRRAVFARGSRGQCCCSGMGSVSRPVLGDPGR